MTGYLAVVGDALLDRDIDGTAERLSPEGPVPVLDEAATTTRAGGAALAAVLAARTGEVVLVTALADDAPGQTLRELIADAGVHLIDLGLDGPTPEKIRLRAGGRTLLRHDRNCTRRAALAETHGVQRALSGADAVLVADYGRGLASYGAIRRALRTAAGRSPLVWDPHPRGRDPVPGCRLTTPNQSEAAALTPDIRGRGLRAVGARADELRERWACDGACITLGSAGALLADGGPSPRVFTATPTAATDACGAGDRFSSAAAEALANGAGPAEAVAAAVHEASAFVAAGGAYSLHDPEPAVGADGRRWALEVAARTRARGGTVVATGGCFDLLHPGHIDTLEAARELGDCLVVLVNSDASVRRLKGDGRPLVPEQDRVRVLRALRCVDAVVVFDENTPERELRRLRPDVFAKGGEYRGRHLPEQSVMREFGGQVVLLPMLDGRSTTGLIERARVDHDD